jgi:hypothetical protein
MNSFLAQIILAARNDDIEGWTNILFIVVLAAFYVAGSIIKAKASKREQAKEQPGLKPTETTPAAGPFQKTPYRRAQPLVHRTPKSQPRPQVQPQRRKIARPQPVAKKFVAEKPDIGLLSFELPEAAELSPAIPSLQPKLAKLPEFTSGAVKRLEAKHIGISEETPQGKYLSEILSDYADASRLRNAILHYEILGKPLSLRDPSAHIIGL